MMKQAKRNTHHRKIAIIASAVIAAAILVTGTFAYFVTDPESEGDWGGQIGVGANLHDDFDQKENRDVYVENYAEADVYVRVRLDEYMSLAGKSLVTGAVQNQYSTWRPHKQQEAANVFSTYWSWEMGSTHGERYYLPTLPSHPDPEAVKKSTAFYGPGAVSSNPELGLRVVPKAEIMTMAQWEARPDNQKIGNYWVGDTDGWYYWAAPLAEKSSTGLLLNAVTLKKKPGSNYFYGINAKMNAADDEELDLLIGVASTQNAKDLLRLISGQGGASYHDTELANAIDRANAALADATANPGRYTAASVAALTAARDTAVLVKNNSTATVAEKEGAIASIDAKLPLVRDTATDSALADALTYAQALLTEANSHSSIFQAGVLSGLSTAATSANAVKNNAAATEAAKKSEIQKLLVAAINVSAGVLTDASANPLNYDASAVTALQTAQTSAIAVRDDASATDANKASAIQRLNINANALLSQVLQVRATPDNGRYGVGFFPIWDDTGNGSKAHTIQVGFSTVDQIYTGLEGWDTTTRTMVDQPYCWNGNIQSSIPMDWILTDGNFTGVTVEALEPILQGSFWVSEDPLDIYTRDVPHAENHDPSIVPQITLNCDFYCWKPDDWVTLENSTMSDIRVVQTEPGGVPANRWMVLLKTPVRITRGTQSTVIDVIVSYYGSYFKSMEYWDLPPMDSFWANRDFA